MMEAERKSRMKTGWLDSHCHIVDKAFENEEEDLIRRAEEAGVVQFLVMATTIEEGYKALKLKEKHENVDIAVGLHPENANDYTEEDLLKLRELLLSGQFSVLGEIGLDYYWVKDNKEKQKWLFERQIDLANEFQLPISIHCRDAISDTYQILKEHPNQKAGVMHCYSSSVEMAYEFIKLGYFISLGGPVTFKNAVTPKEVAARVPLEWLLTETDSPYLTPVPFRGKRNEPMYVKYTAQTICSLRNEEEEAFQKQILSNYYRMVNRDEAN